MIALSRIKCKYLARCNQGIHAGIPIGVEGEFYRGIWIKEENRATGFEFSKEGVAELAKIALWHNAKNIRALVFGTPSQYGTRYAVYVQNGFLREVTEDE